MRHTWLMEIVRAGIGAVAEAVFPKNPRGIPDFETAEMVTRTLEYMEELPPAQRRLYVFFFAFIELAAPLLVPCFSRFSNLAANRRTEAIRGWRRSALLPFRLIGDAAKATMTMMYMSHDSVMVYLQAYKTCGRTSPELEIEHRPQAREALAALVADLPEQKHPK